MEVERAPNAYSRTVSSFDPIELIDPSTMPTPRFLEWDSGRGKVLWKDGREILLSRRPVTWLEQLSLLQAEECPRETVDWIVVIKM